jgi:hypothetical protein
VIVKVVPLMLAGPVTPKVIAKPKEAVAFKV